MFPWVEYLWITDTLVLFINGWDIPLMIFSYGLLAAYVAHLANKPQPKPEW